MNITLVGSIADAVESSSHILKPLKSHLKAAGHKVTSRIGDGTDVLILSMDGKDSKAWLQSRKIPSDVYKIFLVHETSTETAAFFKCADRLVFFNELQDGVVKKSLKCDTPSMVLPYPRLENPSSGRKKDQAVFFCTEYKKDQEGSYLHMLASWWDPKAHKSSGESAKSIRYKLGCEFRCYFQVAKDSQKDFEDFKSKVQENPSIKKAVVHGAPRWRDHKLDLYMSECEYAYLWCAEIPVKITRELISKESLQIIYSPVRESLMLARAESFGCRVIVADGVSMVNKGAARLTMQEYVGAILDDIENNASDVLKSKALDLNSVPTDTLRTLNVVSGGPLHNDYVFVVSFRNQEKKIGRCLDSILRQNREYDYGVVVIDDCSEDGSLQVVLQKLQGSFIDHCVVSNRDRKFASRNLWNAGNLLVSKGRTVMVELDGDDYLEGTRVLEVLAEAYRGGALKTIGSFQTFPNKAESLVNRAHGSQTYDDPWDQGKCSSWCPIRTYRASIFKKVEKEYFIDRVTGTWLTMCHDSAINPRMIALTKGKTVFIPEVLYVYDTSGLDHDAALKDDWTPIWAYNHIQGPISF